MERGRVQRELARPRQSLRGGEIAWLLRTVRNPDDFGRFYQGLEPGQQVTESTPFGGFEPTEFPSTEGPPVHMLIITDTLSAQGASVGGTLAEFQRLADWKTQKGVPTVVRSVQWIRNYYPGPDEPARIRAFIADAYKKWGTDWVLLGGDIDIVPVRRVTNIPAAGSIGAPFDRYYGALDNDWDLNNNGIYAESGEVDLYPEVWIGRAPIHRSEEATVFVNKSLTYSRAPGGSTSGIDDDYYERYLGFASDFSSFGWFPGNNMTYWSELIATQIMPASFDIMRMYRKYDRLSDSCSYYPTYSVVEPLPRRAWQTDSLKYYLSGNGGLGGVGFAYHGEHSNVYAEGGPSGTSPNPPSVLTCTMQVSGGVLGREDVDQLTNGNNLTVIYSRGSYANGFDYESVSERWILNPNGGAVAYVGQVRSQAPAIGNADTLFFSLILSGVARSLGEAAGFLPDAGYYPLLGDPELAAWTSKPKTLTATITPSTFAQPGSHTFTVTVKDQSTNQPVRDALVCLKQTNRAYAFLLTDANGVSSFRMALPTADTLRVTCSAKNYVPLVSNVVSGTLQSPHLFYVEHTAAGAPGMSNSNSLVDAGEKIDLDITVKNGGTSVTGATGKLYASGAVMFTNVTIDDHFPFTMIWLGEADQHPAKTANGTFVFPDPAFSGLNYRGRPAKLDTSSAPGLFIWKDKTRWNVVTRGDPPQFSPHYEDYRGHIIMPGGFSDVTTHGLDSGLYADVLSQVGTDTLSFHFRAGSASDSDTLSFVAREVKWISVTDSVGTFGSIAGGGTATDRFGVRFFNTIPDRHEPMFELVTQDGGGAASGASLFTIPVAAPMPTYIRQRMDPAGNDDTDSPTCTIGNYCREIMATVRNNGSGVADSVRAKLLRTSGSGTLVDTVIVFDTIGALAEKPSGSDIFKFDTPDTSALRFTVQLTNYYPDGTQRTWTKAGIDVVRPCQPTNVTSDVIRPGSVRVRWDLPAGACDALSGFNVHRRYLGAPESSYTIASAAPFDSTRLFQDFGLTPDTTFVLAVASQDTSGNESVKSLAVNQRTWTPMHTGWPQWLDAGTPSSPVVAQLDTSAALEVIATGNSVYAWRHTGKALLSSDGVFFSPSGGMGVATTGRFSSSPAVGDLDDDGDVEVVVAAWNDSLYVLDNNGNRLWAKYIQPLWASPALGDLDGDGKLEVVACGNTGGYLNRGALYAFRFDGSSLSGSANGLWVALPDSSTFNYASPSIAEIDGVTSTREVIFATSKGNVYGWKYISASPKYSLLFSYRPLPIWDNRPMSTVAIGNVDGDAAIEGVVAQGNDGLVS
jgi:hypothetical protein